MNQQMELRDLADTEVMMEEARTREAWIEASATRVAARAAQSVAQRGGGESGPAAQDLLAATVAERAAREQHRWLSDELARRGLRPQRLARAA